MFQLLLGRPNRIYKINYIQHSILWRARVNFCEDSSSTTKNQLTPALNSMDLRMFFADDGNKSLSFYPQSFKTGHTLHSWKTFRNSNATSRIWFSIHCKGFPYWRLGSLKNSPSIIRKQSWCHQYLLCTGISLSCHLLLNISIDFSTKMIGAGNFQIAPHELVIIPICR